MSGESETVQLEPLEEEARRIEARHRLGELEEAQELVRPVFRLDTSRSVGSVGMDLQHPLNKTSTGSAQEAFSVHEKHGPTEEISQAPDRVPVVVVPENIHSDSRQREDQETDTTKTGDARRVENKNHASLMGGPKLQESLQELRTEPAEETEVVRSYDLETMTSDQTPEETLVREAEDFLARLSQETRAEAALLVKESRKIRAEAQAWAKEQEPDEQTKQAKAALDAVIRHARPASEIRKVIEEGQ